VRLRRKIRAWGNCLAGHHEVGGRATRGGWRGRKKAAGVGRRGGEDTSDRWGPVDIETRERRPYREGVNQKGKRISRKDAADARAGWAGRVISACEDHAAGGRAGPEAKRVAGSVGPKVRKRNFRIKIGFLNLTRLWKFVEGDLGGILT
jgi:hypothetical protein